MWSPSPASHRSAPRASARRKLFITELARDPEADFAVRRQRQLVDRGDALLRIDEQPLPIERDDVDLQRLGAGGRRLPRREAAEPTIRVERMRADPSDRAQRDDDQQRRRPDDQFEPGRVIPVRPMLGSLARCAVSPREENRQRHHRHDDQQHQDRRDDEEMRLLPCNISCRIKHLHIAAAQQQEHADRPKNAEPRMRREKRWPVHGSAVPVMLRRSDMTFCPIPHRPPTSYHG